MSPDEPEQQAAPAAEPAPAEAEAPAPAEAQAPTENEGEKTERPADAPRSEEGRERPREGDDEQRGGRRRFYGRRKVCTFCVDHAKSIDYKDPAKLRRYVSDRGRIEARRRTGTCAKHQRWLAVALKRARHLALLPYAPEHIRVTGAFTSRR